MDDSECEEDEVNGNENESDEGEEGKSSVPLLLYTIMGLILHFGDIFIRECPSLRLWFLRVGFLLL